MSDVPRIGTVKIKMRPKGEIVIAVIGGIPQNYTTEIQLSVYDSNEPECTNNPVSALWNVTDQVYVGTATFNGDLTASAHGYNADVTFYENGTLAGSERGIAVEVIAPPTV